MYKLQASSPILRLHRVSSYTPINSWHHRLSCPNFHVLKQVILYTHESFICQDFLANKSHKLFFSKSSLFSKKSLEFFCFFYVWGPTSNQSINGYSYYVIFVDHFSKYVWLFPIKFKSNVSTIFLIFKSLVEKKFTC